MPRCSVPTVSSVLSTCILRPGRSAYRLKWKRRFFGWNVQAGIKKTRSRPGYFDKKRQENKNNCLTEKNRKIQLSFPREKYINRGVILTKQRTCLKCRVCLWRRWNLLLVISDKASWIVYQVRFMQRCWSFIAQLASVTWQPIVNAMKSTFRKSYSVLSPAWTTTYRLSSLLISCLSKS